MSDALRRDAHESARDEVIRAFLKSRPGFVRDDPELMQSLGVRLDAANVVDFGPAALSRVASAHRRETRERRRLESVARDNFEVLGRTHDAVLELVGAADLSDLADRLGGARERLGLAAAVIALEGPEQAPMGWRALAAGQCDMVLGAGRAARLGVAPTAVGLFGGGGGEVGSVALIRLALWSPPRTGILAFAAERPEAFSADMGHELIDFVARVVERVAGRWPPP